MSLRHQPVGATLLLACALSSYGCDAGDLTTQVGPSPIRSQAAFVSRGVLVRPSFIGPVIVPGADCPTHPPFRAPFSLVFEDDGQSEMSLSRLHMQFTDHVGVAGGSMTFDRTDLLSRFGS